MADDLGKTSREERHLMRMRGAGPRSIAAGFDFAFSSSTRCEKDVRMPERINTPDEHISDTLTTAKSSTTASSFDHKPCLLASEASRCQTGIASSPPQIATKKRNLSLKGRRPHVLPTPDTSRPPLHKHRANPMRKRSSTAISGQHITTTSLIRHHSELVTSEMTPAISDSGAHPVGPTSSTANSNVEPQQVRAQKPTRSVQGVSTATATNTSAANDRNVLKSIDSNRSLLLVSDGGKKVDRTEKPCNNTATLKNTRLKIVVEQDDSDPLALDTGFAPLRSKSNPKQSHLRPMILKLPKQRKHIGHSIIMHGPEQTSCEVRNTQLPVETSAGRRAVIDHKSQKRISTKTRTDRRRLAASDDEIDIDDLITNITALTKR